MKTLFVTMMLWASLAAAQDNAGLTPPPLLPSQAQAQEVPTTSTTSVDPAPRSLKTSGRAERFEYVSPVPAGFHEVQSIRKGLLFGGLGVFTACYVLSVGSASGSAWGYVPIVGPFVMGIPAVANTGGSLPFFGALGGVALIVAGVGQAAGAAMAILGVVFPNKWLERDVARVSLNLNVGPGSVSVSGTF